MVYPQLSFAWNKKLSPTDVEDNFFVIRVLDFADQFEAWLERGSSGLPGGGADFTAVFGYEFGRL